MAIWENGNIESKFYSLNGQEKGIARKNSDN